MLNCNPTQPSAFAGTQVPVPPGPVQSKDMTTVEDKRRNLRILKGPMANLERTILIP
jgi:hypothetical protein